MFTKINENTKVLLDFNDGIKVRVDGPETWYYVEIREFLKNSTESYFLEGYHITPIENYCWRSYIFEYNVCFHFDFEILIYKTDLLHGLTKIYQHRYSDNGKFVKFNIDSKSHKESLLWRNRCLDYSKKNGCIPFIQTNFEDINKLHPNYYLSVDLSFYKTYNIGRHPKKSNDFRTLDPRKENTVWFGLWREFWSYQHPRPWSTLTSQEIVDDILGL
jgi:hypothetical protein